MLALGLAAPRALATQTAQAPTGVSDQTVSVKKETRDCYKYEYKHDHYYYYKYCYYYKYDKKHKKHYYKYTLYYYYYKKHDEDKKKRYYDDCSYKYENGDKPGPPKPYKKYCKNEHGYD